MEPSINSDLHDGVDLTRYHFEDLGWFPHTTGVSDQPQAAIALRSAPNPFGSSTTVSFDLERAGGAELGIYDLTGRLVKRLVGRHFAAGRHAATWDGADAGGLRAPAGVYLCRLKLGDRTEMRHLVLID